MSSSLLLAAAKSTPLFFTKMHFWYGVFIALGIFTAIQTLGIPNRIKAWLGSRKNFMLLIAGRAAVPGVTPEVKPLANRLGDVETELLEQHQDIKDQGDYIKTQGADIKGQGVDIQEIKGLLTDVNEKLGTALSIAANTNLKVTANGGNTDSAPDVLQRIAKKMGVWEHEGEPPVSVANIVDLHDVLAAVHTNGDVTPHTHYGLQSGEVTENGNHS